MCAPRGPCAGIGACACGDPTRRDPQRTGGWGLEIFPRFRTTALFVVKRPVIETPACLFPPWGVRLAGRFARSPGWPQACMPSRSKVRGSAKALRISGMCALAVEPSSSILVAVVASAREGITQLPASSSHEEHGCNLQSILSSAGEY